MIVSIYKCSLRLSLATSSSKFDGVNMLINFEFSCDTETVWRGGFDVGKGKYWPNFFTETFAMKKRLLIKVAQQTGYRQEPDRYSSC